MNQARIKNEIRSQNRTYTSKLRNKKVEGKQVCSGFISNPNNKKIIYIDTEGMVTDERRVVLKPAETFKDYSGNPIYADEYDIGAKIVLMLED